MARRLGQAQALRMRTRIMLLALVFAGLACASDDRGRFDLTQDPATAAGDAGDPRRVQALPDGSVANAVGSDVGDGRHPMTGMDAGTLDGGADDAGAAPDAAVGAAYACVTDNDCAIRNVGSCCGYFPRCANANAIFTTPSCAPGMGGTCAFPPIDSCRCELNACVSLRAGVRVNYP